MGKKETKPKSITLKEKIGKRINELKILTQQRQNRLQQFIQKNAMTVEQERAIIQQKIGAIDELQKLLKEGTDEKKDNTPDSKRAGRGKDSGGAGRATGKSPDNPRKAKR